MGIREKQRKTGFTLIEMVVVLAVITLTLPLLFTLLYYMIQAQYKIISLSEVRKQGNEVMTQIRQTVRFSAKDVENKSIVCPVIPTILPVTTLTPYPSIGFTTALGDTFGYGLTSDGIVASYSSTFVTPVPLHSNTVSVEGLEFTCYQSSEYSTPFIYIRYTAQYQSSAGNRENDSRMNFSGAVKLKQY